MRLFCLSLVVLLSAATQSAAEIIWLPTQSTWGTSDTAFVAVPGAPIPGIGAVNPATGPYGTGFNTSGTFAFGFTNAVIFAPPTASQTDLSSTVLTAGTKLVLRFQKAATDRINFVAMLADATQPLALRITSTTAFEIEARIVDPVDSATAQGIGAVFGLVVDYSPQDSLNFGSTLFVTNMHYLDIVTPDAPPSGVAAIKANGLNGVVVDFNAFIPLPMVQRLGLDASNPAVPDAKGYVDGIEVPAGNFQNLGLDSSLGFQFADSENPNNTVLKLKVTNSVWSAHNIQFGEIGGPAPTATPTVDTTGPAITLTGRANRTVKSANALLAGAVADPSGVKSMQFSTASKTKGFKRIKMKGATWSVRLAGLRKNQRLSVFIRATDNLNNVSEILTVRIKRR